MSNAVRVLIHTSDLRIAAISISKVLSATSSWLLLLSDLLPIEDSAETTSPAAHWCVDGLRTFGVWAAFALKLALGRWVVGRLSRDGHGLESITDSFSWRAQKKGSLWATFFCWDRIMSYHGFLEATSLMDFSGKHGRWIPDNGAFGVDWLVARLVGWVGG